MTPHKQAVIFDWNGTIPDDAQLMCDATNEILALLGTQPINVERYREVFNVPVNKTYEMLGCCTNKMEQYKHEMVEVWRDHVENHIDKVQLRSGAAEVLAAIKAMGHSTAVLSNYVDESISRQALKLGIHDYFDTILARRPEDLKDVMHSQGKGERLHGFIKQNGIEQGIVVGDSPEEVEIARQFGFTSVGILDGLCSDHRVCAAKPDHTIRSLHELPPIVRRVFHSGRNK